ncbi:LysR family transcriptional regulator [Halomonas sp. GT]|uniref:LysR family transcriptional regulator n=1 Tax=Halomonas sp. GT TaxID=1971364 RepID=UPI0009F55C2E|nr:LysR family transcriptional regulator [Halomonas sp. GT]
MTLFPESALRFEALLALSSVAKHGSVKSATETCSFSESKLHRLLRVQEQRLGVALINRSTIGSSLTSAGEQLRSHADELIHAVANAETNACHEHLELNGTLRLQTPQALIEPLMLPLVLMMQAAYPELKIYLQADEYSHLEDTGVQAHICLAFEPLSETLYARPLGCLRTGLFASPSYLDKAGRPDCVQELARHDLIHCPKEGQAPVWHLANDGSIRFQPKLSVNSSVAAVQAATDGAGIVRCYQLEARQACEKGLLEPVLTAFWPAADSLALTYAFGLWAPTSVIAFLELATPWLRTQLLD